MATRVKTQVRGSVVAMRLSQTAIAKLGDKVFILKGYFGMFMELFVPFSFMLVPMKIGLAAVAGGFATLAGAAALYAKTNKKTNKSLDVMIRNFKALLANIGRAVVGGQTLAQVFDRITKVIKIANAWVNKWAATLSKFMYEVMGGLVHDVKIVVKEIGALISILAIMGKMFVWAFHTAADAAISAMRLIGDASHTVFGFLSDILEDLGVPAKANPFLLLNNGAVALSNEMDVLEAKSKALAGSFGVTSGLGGLSPKKWGEDFHKNKILPLLNALNQTSVMFFGMSKNLDMGKPVTADDFKDKKKGKKPKKPKEAKISFDQNLLQYRVGIQAMMEAMGREHLQAILDRMIQKLREMIPELQRIKEAFLFLNTEVGGGIARGFFPEIDRFTGKIKNQNDQINDLAANVGGTLRSSLEDLGGTFANTMGQFAVGAGSLKEFGEAIGDFFSNLSGQIGSFFVNTGIGMLLINPGMGAALIAAGLALQMVGGAIEGAYGSGSDKGGGSGGSEQRIFDIDRRFRKDPESDEKNFNIEVVIAGRHIDKPMVDVIDSLSRLRRSRHLNRSGAI